MARDLGEDLFGVVERVVAHLLLTFCIWLILTVAINYTFASVFSFVWLIFWPMYYSKD